MIIRKEYLSKLIQAKDTPVVKIITGIRRCGKSSLLLTFLDELKKENVKSENIIYINFESLATKEIKNYADLYSKIKNERKNNKAHFYLLLDELQNVEGWEKAISSFMTDFDIDIYVTGSNSKLLSSEFATHIAGRYIEIKMYPLTFSEFLEFKKDNSEDSKSTRELFFEYVKFGGMPGIHFMNQNEILISQYLTDIYNSIILKDVVERNKISSPEKLSLTTKYIFDNIGNIFSARTVSNFVKSQSRKISNDAVYSFLHALEGAFIINKVPRYDIKGKQLLETLEKYYVTDIGIRNAVNGFKDNDINGLLENIVFIELLSRGYKVYIGKQNNLEVDFVAEKKEERIYIQVAYQLTTKETTDREFKPFESISDNYEKLILTLDETPSFNRNGIKRLSLIDWLFNKLNLH